MAKGSVAAPAGARRAALQPVALALLVTGGVGYYSFRTVADGQLPAQPDRTSQAALSATVGAIPVETQKLAVVDMPAATPLAPVMVEPIAAPQMIPAQTVPVAAPAPVTVTVPVPASAQFAPTAASAPRAGARRRITGRFQPASAPVGGELSSPIAAPALMAPPPAALTIEAPVMPVVSIGPAAPAIAAPTAEPLAAPLVPQIAPVDAPGPEPLTAPVVETPKADLVPAAAPVAAPAPAPEAPAPVAAIVPVAPRSEALVPVRRAAVQVPAATRRSAAPSAPPAPRAAFARYRMADGAVEFAIPTRLDNSELGTLPLRIGQGDAVSVRLGDLLAMLQTRMDAATYDRLSMSSAADEYVDFDALRRAGIAVQYDASRNHLVLGLNRTL